MYKYKGGLAFILSQSLNLLSGIFRWKYFVQFIFLHNEMVEDA